MYIAIIESAAKYIRSEGGAVLLYPERRGTSHCRGCSNCEICTLVVPAVRLGVPQETDLDKFHFLDQDGYKIWVHKKLRPKGDRPILIDSFRLPLSKPRLVLKHSAYAPAAQS